jgi:pimeloyl-ACP methyl ester carboxylesterase
MLHGFGTTGDMWGHLASALIEDHMVVAPDLRGLGLSSKPDRGYDKKNQAADVVGVLDALDVRTAELVTHDIGTIWAFSSHSRRTRHASGRTSAGGFSPAPRASCAGNRRVRIGGHEDREIIPPPRAIVDDAAN